MGLQDRANTWLPVPGDLSDCYQSNALTPILFSPYAEPPGQKCQIVRRFVWECCSKGYLYRSAHISHIGCRRIRQIQPNGLFSVPFPGNLYSAFSRVANIKALFKEIKLQWVELSQYGNCVPDRCQGVWKLCLLYCLDEGKGP